MNAKLQKTLLIAAEVLLVLVIIGLILANWMPVIVGARSFRPAP